MFRPKVVSKKFVILLIFQFHYDAVHKGLVKKYRGGRGGGGGGPEHLEIWLIKNT